MAADKIRVYFTIDTETSVGGAWDNGGPVLPLAKPVFGESGSRFYGVPLIMDILEGHGFAATFFIEVFCSYHVGPEQLGKLFECIQRRGHDVQLHLHPVQRFYWEFLQGGDRREEDLLFQCSLEEQHKLIAEGVALFRQLSGKAPVAFRAGCYGASETTLTALRANGILIDSSYNLAFLDKTCGFRYRPLNAPRAMDGVYEVPVTNFHSGRRRAFKPLEISAVSVSEIMVTIRALRTAGCRDAVLVFHSFSFLKQRGSRFQNCRPDRVVIHRFRQLCSELARLRDEVEVSVLGAVDLSEMRNDNPQVVPSVGWLRPAIRKVVQGLDYIPWV